MQFKVQSLRDQNLNTGYGRYELTEGQIFVGEFKDEQSLNSFIQLGVLKKVPKEVKIQKPIPVILLTEEGQELPLSSNSVNEFFKVEE